MNKLGTLYKSTDNSVIDAPHKCQKPFDKDRKGIVLGEGSGFFVIESLESAIKRKSKIYCEITGYSTNGDSHHLTKPMESGFGGFLSMASALAQSKNSMSLIDMVSCHATATDVGDTCELNAMLKIFASELKDNNNLKYFLNTRYDKLESEYNSLSTSKKENLKNLSILASKTQLGHLLGASGSVELIIAIYCMKNSILIDNYNTINPISDDFNFRNNGLTPYTSSKKIRGLIKNSFAFGGVNSSIVLENYS